MAKQKKTGNRKLMEERIKREEARQAQIAQEARIGTGEIDGTPFNWNYETGQQE